MARFRVNFLAIIVCVLVFGGCENPSGGGEEYHPYPAGAVEDIINLPITAYVGENTPLTGAVIPADAATKTITWRIVEAGETGAVIEGDTLTTTAAGTVRIEAVIANGVRADKDFKKEFSVEVKARPEYGVRLRINRIEPTDGHTFTSTDPVTVTIENIGKNSTGELTVTLSGSNPTSFQLDSASVSSIAADGEGSFTVAPANNLSSGTHTATVSVTGGNNISATFNVSYTVPATPAGEQATHTYGGFTMNFRYVPPSPQAFAINEDENTASITRGYWVMETEVTQELWSKVFSDDPSFFDGNADDDDYDFSKATPDGETQNKRPVDSVNWYAAIAFCNKLSTLTQKTRVYKSDEISNFNTDNYWQNLDFSDIPKYEEANEDWDAITMNKDANGYRLPTEVEWLWAAIGATEGGADVYTKGCIKGYAGSIEDWDEYGAIMNYVEEYAWYSDNSDDVTHQVGLKTANELDLYDMSGNVQEWCFDWYEMNNWYNDLDPDYVQDTTTEDDPTRMTHGGSFYDYYEISPSERYYLEPYIGGDPEEGYCAFFGFRIVCNE